MKNAKGTKRANADLTNQELLDISQEELQKQEAKKLKVMIETEGTPGEAVLTNGSAQTTVAQAKLQENRCVPRIKKHCSRS